MTDYKNTLNLPHTKFSMQGSLPKREPEILQHWYTTGLYGMIRTAKKGKKLFVLHDGPPYANGNIHIGHSVNKILKDIIIKSKGLAGYDSPYVPGWDCHGLPIELQVEKLIGKPDEKVSATEFRNACRRYATEQVAKQKQAFIRLGVLGDWEHPYLTMDFSTEANIIRALSKIIANGHLHKATKPVHWCIDCRSALAEAEVEYYDRTSIFIDTTFLAKDSSCVAARFKVINFSKPVSAIIWTSTPWTIPANRAICIHPTLRYQLVEVNKQALIIAEDLVESVMRRIGFKNWSILGSTKGSTLEFLRFHHPFMNFDVPIILSQHITQDAGTGIVHTAPGHGPEDYVIGQQYNLEIANLVGPDGCYLPDTFPSLDGLQVFKTNEIIIELLRNNGSLLHTIKLQHSYPHCWRHKTPIIFRATTQWFLSMEKNNLRKQSLEAIKEVQWIPGWGKTHIKNMITHRPDWCISRQRTWGVPMSLFIHKKTETLHPDTLELMEEVAKRVEKKGIQAWWDLDVNEILGDTAANYKKLTHTLDVWFDSGSTHSSVVTVRPEFSGHEPDMYLEGSDQHRGWFMSSLMISSAIRGKASYRKVITHGFTIDAQKRKMSKSLGNVLHPQQIIDKLGADILRLWVASTDYTGEMVVSHQILKHSTDVYRRIRNTARFLLANLKDFNPILHSVSPNQMIVLDRWAIGRALSAQTKIITAYTDYNFHNVVQCIMRFCSVEMGSFYLEIIKDRQYTTKTDSIARRSCQTALYHILEALVRWISPIMSFTADDIWRFMPGERPQSVFTEEWYEGLFGLDNKQQMNDAYWETLLQVRSEVNKVIEQARRDKQIGCSLESQVILYAEPTLATQLRELDHELCFALLTSAATVKDYIYTYNDVQQNKRLKITWSKANGKKCPRCWHYKMDIGQCTEHPNICGRCIINVIGLGEERKFI